MEGTETAEVSRMGLKITRSKVTWPKVTQYGPSFAGPRSQPKVTRPKFLRPNITSNGLHPTPSKKNQKITVVPKCKKIFKLNSNFHPLRLIPVGQMPGGPRDLQTVYYKGDDALALILAHPGTVCALTCAPCE